MARLKTAFGWKDGGKFYVSAAPREAGAAASGYDNPTAALQAASARGMILKWEDPAEIDGKK